jgi:hypothetical protein
MWPMDAAAIERLDFAKLIAARRLAKLGMDLVSGLPPDEDVRDAYLTASTDLLIDATHEIERRVMFVDWIREQRVGGFG